MLRAGAGTLVAVALLSGSARADVFVPDDPAPHDVACVAAAGDIVAVVRQDGRRWRVEVSEAGGPWRLIRRPGHLVRCPRVAAAADGTAIIGLSDRVVVRRPGQAFGPPVALGRDVEAAAVAAAPGGWTAAVGERVRKSLRNDLVATVVAPDGTTRAANLDRTRSTRLRNESFLLPRIGIDARGAATIVWTRWDVITDDYVLRTSGTAGGTAWAAPRTLSAGDASVSFPTVGHADLAVAPGGRTLLVWADGRGLNASVDGGPVERLPVQRRAGSPTATIADDGSAVVAYGVPRSRVLATDRGPDGLWNGPHELAGNDLGPISLPDLGVLHEAVLTSVLAPDGRVTVAWEAFRRVGRRLVAASGRSGGGWTTAAPVSLITRDVVASSLGVTASGEPRLMWIETAATDGPPDRLRAARLAPELLDRTAPTLTTRLPARAPRERAGHFTFAIPVTCSEACDARLRLLEPDRLEVAGVVRELLPGAERILRLTIPRTLARNLAELQRRPWLQVLVTDRAGNVARESRRVRFR